MQNKETTRYSDQPRDPIIVKVYGFLLFAKKMGKNINKNISKNTSGKYCQKFLYHTKQTAADSLKTVATKRATGNLIGQKIADKCAKVSKGFPQNISEAAESETQHIRFDIEIPKKYIYAPQIKDRKL